MNFNVTEFFVIFTYHQLSETGDNDMREQPCLPDLTTQSCSICTVAFGDVEDFEERLNQRLAVTPCYHIFHETCLKDYITNIFRFYVARAYALFPRLPEPIPPNPYPIILLEHTIPHPMPLNNVTPYFANSRAGRVRPYGQDIYNPFGHAPHDPPGPVLSVHRNMPKLTCPVCNHYLDQELDPNSESSRCFMAYFQRHRIEYPTLVPRYTFLNDDNLDGINPMYRIVREVAHFDPRIMDRTNTHYFYDMPGHEHVNNYFELPQIRAYYALHQHDDDNAFWYGIPRDERDAVHAARQAAMAQVDPVIAQVEPAMLPLDPIINAINPIKVTEFYRLFSYATLRAAMTDARHCFDIEGVDEVNQDKCTICTELLDNPEYDPNTIAVSGCFHLFHKTCIDDYINDRFRNILAIRANAIRQVAEAELLLNQPFGRVGQYTELFNCPSCRRLLDQQPDVDNQKARCFKNYLHRMHIPYPNLLDRVQLRGRDIYRDYTVVPNTLTDEGYRVMFRNLHELRPEYVRNAEGVDVLQPIRNVRTNNYDVHVDENGVFRNDQLDHVDFFGNPADPPTIYMNLHDPHFSERHQNRKYYDQYPERNKYMDIVYQDYVLLQPDRVHIIGDEAPPAVRMPEAPLAVRMPEVQPVIPMREAAPAIRHVLDGKECGPTRGPAYIRWTRAQLEDLARRAAIPSADIRRSTIPQLCHALRNVRMGDGPAPVPVPVRAPVPVPVPMRMPELAPVGGNMLDGKECGPVRGPASQRWTRPQLVDLARRADIPDADIRRLTIPQLCHTLRNMRMPAGAGVAPGPAPVPAPALAPAPFVPASLPICREGKPKSRNRQRDLNLQNAKKLASRHGVDNKGKKSILCNRLINRVPPLARHPFADEGRRTQRRTKYKRKHKKNRSKANR
jgi:hypothetical protein